LTNYLLETIKDESFRLHVLDEAIERFRSTLFRQTMFADFEHQIHTVVENGGALVPDNLDKIYRGLKEEFYKPVKMDDYIQREWMRIPHFYYNYYVYQYATGLSAAMALSKGVLSKENGALKKYISFLESGSSAHPLELLEKAGVDLKSKTPIENAIEVYGKYISEMELIIN
jgi:oligoendopeptidase F